MNAEYVTFGDEQVVEDGGQRLGEHGEQRLAPVAAASEPSGRLQKDPLGHILCYSNALS